MWFIAGPPSVLYEALLQKTQEQNIATVGLKVERYWDGELRVDFLKEQIERGAGGQKVLIQLPLPNASETVVNAIIASYMIDCDLLCWPYFPYGRNSIFISALMPSLKGKILTVDAHHHDLSFSNWQNILPTQMFAESLRKTENLKSACVIAPDKGSKFRGEQLAEVLGIPFLQATKLRDGGACSVILPRVPSFQTYILIDDMMASGATVLATLQALKKAGVKGRIILAITHQLPVLGKKTLGEIVRQTDHILVTDSFDALLPSKVVLLPLADFLVSEILKALSSSDHSSR